MLEKLDALLRENSQITGLPPYFGLQCIGISCIFWFICFFASETLFWVPKSWAAAVKPRDLMKIKHRLATCVHGTVNMTLGMIWWFT